VLEAIEQFWLAEYLRRSVLAYPIVNALHILSLGTLAVGAMLMDLRIIGWGSRLPLDEVIFYLRRVAVVGVTGAVVTGLMLFSVQPKAYAGNPVFWIKLAILAVALTNAAIFTFRRQHRRADAPATIAMASFSIVVWLGVIMAGRGIAFYE